MKTDITALAESFVGFVLQVNWSDSQLIFDESTEFLLKDLMSAAGFSVQRIGTRYLTELKRVQVVAFGCDNNNHEFATGWINCAIRLIVLSVEVSNPGKHFLVKRIVEEVNRSVPFKRMRLTRNGDFLCEFPPGPRRENVGYRFFVDHTREDSSLISRVGLHEHCWGWIERLDAQDKSFIVCMGCTDIRVEFPRTVQTFGELRAFLRSQGIE